MSAQPHNIVDQGDVNDWKNRFNSALADHTIVTAPTSESARPWRTGFFDCFAPIDLCAITCCLPCITFGKTHHRTRKSPELHEYNCVNTSCLMFTGFSCFGLHWIPIWIQRADIRKKYGLRGDLVTDLLTSCCCGCCSLIQQDKEVECQEELLKQKADVGGYQKTDAMAYQH